MTNIDQFESVFKAADKPAFAHEAVRIESVLVVTDLEPAVAGEYREQLEKLLSPLDNKEIIRWNLLTKADYSSVSQLLELVQRHQPQLICTYRNLHIPATEYPHSLGVYVDVLTQVTKVPVLLLPHPQRKSPVDLARGFNTVMAITDHLAADHHLVSYSVAFTKKDGDLLLAHVEDEQTFDRYLATISKIPEIDTDDARELILEQLLQDPKDYVRSCREVLEAEGVSLKVEEIVTIGHRLADYKRLIKEHQVDLLVINTKDEDQLAMHGLAYPLSVEMRDVPLLLL